MDSWTTVYGEDLQQGDLLAECYVPIYPDTFGEGKEGEVVPVDVYNVIVITQTCDLANGKTRLVAVVPIYSLGEFEEVNKEFGRKGRWDEVRKGRIEGLHLLPSPKEPSNGRASLVADFREIYSLPLQYLKKRARQLGSRSRLCSPMREDFSRAFGNYYSRVAITRQFEKIE